MIKKLFFLFRKKNEIESLEFDSRKREKILNKIESLVGIKPNKHHFYLKAFTHRSYLEKSKTEIKSNERLEFLGDSILGKITAEFLFKEYPHQEEGFLTKSRSHLVNKHSLEKIGFGLKLHDLIFINDNYLTKDKKKLSNVVADCVEALIAAIYLDMGEKIATEFVIKYVIKPQVDSGDINYDTNYKGQLLEYAHAEKLNQPQYKVLSQEGPQHDKTYVIEVVINECIRGIGKGPNKKIAEQNAAKTALEIAIQDKTKLE